MSSVTVGQRLPRLWQVAKMPVKIAHSNCHCLYSPQHSSKIIQGPSNHFVEVNQDLFTFQSKSMAQIVLIKRVYPLLELEKYANIHINVCLNVKKF